MKNYQIIFLSLVIIFLGCIQAQAEDGQILKITKPNNGDELKGPIEVCMAVKNLVVEPAKMGVNEGKGHHHILFSSLPADLSQPLGKKKVVHMGSGVSCHTFKLAAGKHSLLALFAYGNHIPYDPPISDKILITVSE
jgi:hypothetical protein